jgi:rhodanese-related sulfurtransferase
MTLKEIIKDPATKFVDVRTVIEFGSGHIHGALNIPLDQFQHRYTEIKDLGKSPIVFYCRSGNRSGQAVSWLQQMGIKNIYNGGGLEDVQCHLN